MSLSVQNLGISTAGVSVGGGGGAGGASATLKLLANFEGTDQSRVYTSDNGIEAVFGGSASDIDAAQFKFGATSGRVFSETHYIQFPTAIDWTKPVEIEFFRARDFAGNATLNYLLDVERMFQVTQNSTKFGVRFQGAAGTPIYSAAATGINNLNEFHHCHLTYDPAGPTLKLAFDGMLTLDQTVLALDTGIQTPTGDTTLGNLPSPSGIASNNARGWIDALRITEGLTGLIGTEPTEAPTADFTEARVNPPIGVIGVFSTTAQSSTTGNTMTLTDPLENDIVILCRVADNMTSSWPDPDEGGYTNEYVSASNVPSTRVDWKRLGASPDAAVTIDGIPAGGGGNDQACIAIQLRGVDPTTLFDVTTVTASGGSGLPDPGSITPTTDGSLIIAFGALDDDETGLNAAPAGYSNGTFQTSGGAAESAAIAGVATLLQTTAGAENPAAFGGTGDDSWEAITLAIRPA